MNEIKEFFDIIKKDILSLNQEIQNLKLNISNLKGQIENLNLNVKNFSYTNPISAQKVYFQTQNNENPTDKELFKSLKAQNLHISTGNQGVQTDKQTNQQIDKKHGSGQNLGLDSADYLLGSLDHIKKELRLKFKRLTPQEMAVFSSVYLTEQILGYTNYKIIADKLGLTESSIRDYVRRLILKGIPLEKEKLNNKEILIRVSSNLRKITTLETLQKIRDL